MVEIFPKITNLHEMENSSGRSLDCFIKERKVQASNALALALTPSLQSGSDITILLYGIAGTAFGSIFERTIILTTQNNASQRLAESALLVSAELVVSAIAFASGNLNFAAAGAGAIVGTGVSAVRNWSRFDNTE